MIKRYKIAVFVLVILLFFAILTGVIVFSIFRDPGTKSLKLVPYRAFVESKIKDDFNSIKNRSESSEIGDLDKSMDLLIELNGLENITVMLIEFSTSKEKGIKEEGIICYRISMDKSYKNEFNKHSMPVRWELYWGIQDGYSKLVSIKNILGIK